MLLELFICFVVLYLLYRLWSKREVYRLGRQLNSGLMSLPLVGHSYLFIGDSENSMKTIDTLGKDAIKNKNGLTSFWVGPNLYTFVADPEAAELILKTCLEKDDTMNMLKLFLGNGSIFAPVSIWRPRRKVLVPSFGTKNLKNFFSVFVRQSTELVQQMKRVVGKGNVSVWPFFTTYTMDSIAEIALGCELNAQKESKHPFLEAFDRALSSCGKRLLQPWLHSDLVYNHLPIHKQLVKDKKYLWSFIDELIEQKREEIKIKQDQHDKSASDESLKTFLELLITSSGGNDGYTNVEITEEAMVMLIAGNDTSAVATSFITVMLSRHVDVQNKVYEELREIFGDSDRPITSEDLPRLRYLDAVIRETLRLYPPVPLITRKVEKYVKLPCGTTLVPGTGVVVSVRAIHRNPRYWGEKVDEFLPERFFDLHIEHPAAYMPFSYGPRNCVGYQFSMNSMKTALSSFLRHYTVLPATEKTKNTGHPPIRLKFDLIMKDVEYFQVKIERRPN